MDLAQRWSDLLDRYTIYIRYERSLARNSVESYLRDLHNFASFIEGEYSLSACDLSREHIEAYMEELYRLNMQSSTASRVLSSIKSLFEYLMLEGEISYSPAQGVASPRQERHLPDVLTLEQIDAIIESIPSDTFKGARDRAIIELLYSCGLRVSEATGLRLSDLFFEDGYIRVVGKGDKQRLVPISRIAERRIREYIALREEQYQEAGRVANTLFLNNRAGSLSRVMVFTLIKGYARAAGVEGVVSPHTLRHSFATHLLEGGASIREVQEMLGHESITTTEIYTHVSRRHIRDVMERSLPL